MYHQKNRKTFTVDYTPKDDYVLNMAGNATYSEIRAYVLKEHGLKVSTAQVAEIKRQCGLEMRDCYNREIDTPPASSHMTAEKKEAILKALRHFRMIDEEKTP